MGDTFRWKGENVATGEVAAVLAHAPGVEEADVYGVEAPGTEGRAGMAALVTGDGFDLGALAREVDTHLPPYARPLFLRLRPALETTGTFKYRKTDAVAEGFDPSRVADPLYLARARRRLRPAGHGRLRTDRGGRGASLAGPFLPRLRGRGTGEAGGGGDATLVRSA